MQGLHLTADLQGCRCAPRWLLDADALGQACLDAVRAATSAAFTVAEPIGRF